MPYHLEGRLLEVCNCRVLCPCWIGEDPDFGTCDTIVAWHMDKGTIKLGDAGYAELEPYLSASGATTTLADTVFSTVPGAPVFVGKSPKYKSKNAKLGIDLDMSGHNALQSTFLFDG